MRIPVGVGQPGSVFNWAAFDSLNVIDRDGKVQPDLATSSSSADAKTWTFKLRNDIKFQVAYQSDLAFVAKVMRETAEEEVGEAMMERIRTYRELLQQTPVDELEVQERPVFVFRVGQNTWIEAIVRYLVEPRRAGPVKTRLIKKMLERLNTEPE